MVRNERRAERQPSRLKHQMKEDEKNVLLRRASHPALLYSLCLRTSNLRSHAHALLKLPSGQSSNGLPIFRFEVPLSSAIGRLHSHPFQERRGEAGKFEDGRNGVLVNC